MNAKRTVYINGNIHTVDSLNRYVESMCVQNGRIVCTGSNEDTELFRSKSAEIIDLQGLTVIPGLIDSHCHIMGLGSRLQKVDLSNAKDERDAAELVKQRADASKPGQWILGMGWDQNKWKPARNPTAELLNTAVPGHPVYLVRVDGHTAWVNHAAMKAAGIDDNTPDPAGGKIFREHQSGSPTGLLQESALKLITGTIPSRTDDQYVNSVKRACDECLKYGITSVHDAGVKARTLNIYKDLTEKNQLPLRIYAMLTASGKDLTELFQTGPVTGDFLTVRSIKRLMDGALGSRGAAMLEPYTDDPGNSGILTCDQDLLYTEMTEALQYGFQMCVHAIGDRSARVILNCIEKTLVKQPETDHRFRIEHAQIVHPDDIGRFAKLGVIPAMQPSHAVADMPWAEKRIGKERIRYAYAWSDFFDKKLPVTNGSDFPVEPVNPLYGFYTAVTRQDRNGFPEGGWYPQQRMSRTEALRGYTINAAYAAFEEELKGSLEVGKLADFTVLSDDIMTVPPEDILSVKVVKTVIGGKTAYTAG